MFARVGAPPRNAGGAFSCRLRCSSAPVPEGSI